MNSKKTFLDINEDDTKDLLTDAKEFLKVWAPILLICFITMGITYLLFVEAPPPQRFVFATGDPNGAYYSFGKKYAEILKKSGFQMEIESTAGSTENLQKLLDPKSNVSLAFVQGGIANPQKHQKDLFALGSFYREPLWVFYRGKEKQKYLADFAGKTLAIGAKGSGTLEVSLLLLKENGITEKTPQTKLLPLGGSNAMEALKKGTIDAAFMVASIEANYIKELLQTEDIQVMDFERFESYQRRYKFLSSIKIPAGLISLSDNVPPKPITLLAPTATIIARRDIHPELVPLILEATKEVHRQGTLLDSPEEFPDTQFVDIPISPEARRYLKNGPSFLYRNLPFWLASMIHRLKILLLPLITLLFPIVKVAPPVYRWRIRSKIFRWYALLREADLKLLAGVPIEELKPEFEKLRHLENDLSSVKVPLSYMVEFYNLRLHIDFLEKRIKTRLTDVSLQEKTPPVG